jgi:hypothetical protein
VNYHVQLYVEIALGVPGQLSYRRPSPVSFVLKQIVFAVPSPGFMTVDEIRINDFDPLEGLYDTGPGGKFDAFVFSPLSRHRPEFSKEIHEGDSIFWTGAYSGLHTTGRGEWLVQVWLAGDTL